MDSARSAQRALLVLLIASLALVIWVMRPIAIALFLAAVLAAAFWPLHVALTRLFKGRQRIAAGVAVVLVVVVILGPLVGLSAFVVKEGAQGLRFVQNTLRGEGVAGLVRRLPDSLEKPVNDLLQQIPLNPSNGQTVGQQLKAQSGRAAAVLGSAVAATGSLIFQAAMMLIAFYFFLTNRNEVLRFIDEASPLRKGQTRELLIETRNVSVAVLRSTFLTAAVQAVAAIIGYYIARVPYPLFFGFVTFFVALIPAIGAASVCLVLAALLALTGHFAAAIFLAIWGVAVVGLVDNIVKPWLIKGGVGMHGAVVFFALLGGLAAFGTIGLLLGPLAVSFFVALLRIYRRDYGPGSRPTEKPTPPPKVPRRPLEA